MRPRIPPGRDTTVLLLVFVAGLAVMALVPPSSPPAAPSAAARAAASNGRTGASSAAAGGSTPAPSSGAADTATPTSSQPTVTTGQASTGSTATTPGSGGGSNAGTAQRIKLMDSRYARYAYLISGKTLSPDATRALDGFEWNRTRVNATTVRITLTPDEPRYQQYSVLVRNDRKLYFLETSFGDDAPKRENQLNDDAPVMVDHDGYVVQ